MPAIDIGRICTKIAGRESGRKCVIIDLIDKNFVLITGPEDVSGIKRRRVNVSHITPTEDKLEISRGASDEDVTKALDAAGKTQAFQERAKP